MFPDADDINPSDCCGNGCSNCILNTPTLPTRNSKSKYKGHKNALLIYRKYKLLERTQLLRNILELKFKLPNKEIADSLVLDIPPGHHVMMRAPDYEVVGISNNCDSNGSTNAITRPYSPFSVNSDNLTMEILVNLSPGGKMSRYIQQLKVGDSVEFRGPTGTFIHEPNSYETLLIFTNGVAVAPVIRIIEEVLDNEDDMTRVQLKSCFTDLDTILFRDRLYRYNNYWNFTSTIYLSREKCSECGIDAIRNICPHFKGKLKYKENVQPARLNEEEILNILKKLSKDPFKIVICGSKAFEQFVSKAINFVDFNRENISIL